MSDMKDMKLNDDQLDGVAGGAIFYAGGVSGSDPKAPWEVINDSDRKIGDAKRGDVVGRFETRDEAMAAASRAGLSQTEISYNMVENLRK